MVRLARVCLAHAAVAGILCGACVLKLDDLSSGGTGGATSTSTGSGSSGGSGGGAWCPLLDCSCSSAPEVVAAGFPLADGPRGVATTSDGVFWVNDTTGAVVEAPAGGGAPQKLTGANAPRALDAHGTTLVWTAQEGLFTCLLPSCDGSKHEVLGAAAPGSLRDVAYDGHAVVWSDAGSGNHSGKVMTCVLGGCSPVSLADNLIAPDGVALYGDSAFWVDQGDNSPDGSAARSPVATPGMVGIASGLDQPAHVAADDSYVYWTEGIPMGHVVRCPYPASCAAPEDIAPAAGGFPRPNDIRVAGGRIYWTNTDDGSILSCPQQGCSGAMPKVHVTGRHSLQRMAVGTSCIFWTEDGDGGAVMKVPR
jgi:hypothetical protein